MTPFPLILPSVLGELQLASCLCATAVGEGPLNSRVLTNPKEGDLE